ncbi:MAG TPA: hypothetical protein VMR46_03870 [Candidatus Paceibacterota bacterium]|nr:hypothetical protein [Candidatus Paceibacterota bacterium]
MRLTDEHIAKFQRLYKARFGKEISKEDAHAQGIKLLRTMQLIYKPMTKDEHERVQKRQAFLKSLITQ